VEITIIEKEKAVVVSAQGRITATTAPDFESRLADPLEKDQQVLIIDMSGIDYISSAGLRVILLTAKKLKAQQGDLLLAALQSAVKEIFEMSGFLSIFKTFDTVEDALDSI
jgi:anti-anti-sigma factor